MSNHISFIADLNQLDFDNSEIGNKAANLSKLIQYKFSVPEGFVIKTNAYNEFVRFNNLNNIIQESLRKILYDNYETIEKCSKTIQNSILNSEIHSDLVDELEIKYKKYSSHNVAVRSSATAEDLPTASFAGQYDSYLNLKNLNQIIDHIKKCYASLWTNRAISYRYRNKIPMKRLKLQLLLQKDGTSEVCRSSFYLKSINIQE